MTAYLNPDDDRFYEEGVKLRIKWNKMLRNLDPNFLNNRDLMNETFLNLFFRYSSFERHYHNPVHILECLTEFKDLESLSNHPEEIKLALFFHDSIYDTPAKDNEEKSAEFMREVMGRVINKNSLDISARVIFATKHNYLVTDTDERLGVSIDLSILGKSWSRYQDYMAGIRKEYFLVEKKDYCLGRAKVLEGFLAREKIYPHSFFEEKYERTGRENLAREIDMLTKYRLS